MRRLLPVLALSLVASAAAADQCIVVERTVANVAALAITASHGRLLEHCAPCDDPPPALASAFLPGQVDVGTDSLRIDGRERDLAYLYLEVSPNVFENVALRAGCPAVEVLEVWDFTGGSARSRRFTAPPPTLRALGWGGSPTSSGRGRPPPPG